MIERIGVTAIVFGALTLGSVPMAAQWPAIKDPNVPRDAKGELRRDAPTPRTPDGKPDLSGLWMHANSGPPGGRGGRGGGGRQGDGPPGGAPPGGPGTFRLEAPTQAFPYDPNGPPVAAFFEAGQNMEGGLPYTQWARDIKKKRFNGNMSQEREPARRKTPLCFLLDAPGQEIRAHSRLPDRHLKHLSVPLRSSEPECRCSERSAPGPPKNSCRKVMALQCGA